MGLVGPNFGPMNLAVRDYTYNTPLKFSNCIIALYINIIQFYSSKIYIVKSFPTSSSIIATYLWSGCTHVGNEQITLCMPVCQGISIS